MDSPVATCLLLTKVLTADGIMTADERAFLEEAMSRFGIAAEDRRRIHDLEGWDDAEAVLNGLSEEEKREVVSALVDAAAADRHLSAREAAIVKKISTALGLT